MAKQATYSIEKENAETAVLRLHGRLDQAHIGRLWDELLQSLAKLEESHLICDFEEVSGIDTAGMALLRTIEERCAKRDIRLSRRHLSESVENFLRYERRRSAGEEKEQAPSRAPGWVERVGISGEQRLDRGYRLVEFVGKVVEAIGMVVRHPGQLRMKEFLQQFQKVGADAVPLVFSLSALMGLVIVFQGLSTTRRFGADIYIADMVALSVTSQMAPLLTAIIVSGRSGAAFSAEIGSMKIRQELDVLSVMNFNITGFIVLPRILAIMVATPLLTLVSDAAGIIGGYVTSSFVLDLTMEAYFNETRSALEASKIYTGVIKGGVFGFLIGMTGCFHGMMTEDTADSVGVQTTSAVVSGILLIILANSAFAYIFNLFGW